MPGVLRDRAGRDAGRRDAGPAAPGHHPVRRARVGLRAGGAARPGRAVAGRGPGSRDLLRLPADGVRPRRHRAPHRLRRVRRDRARRAAGGRRPARRPARPPAGVDVARRHLRHRAPRLRGHGADRRHAGRRGRGPGQAALRRPVPSRGAAHRARDGAAAPLPGRRGLPADLDHARRDRGADRADRRAGRRRPRDLRAVRRRGLRGGRRPGPAGHRAPAELRVR